MKLLRKLRAKFFGSFVSDCPRCHKHFYGHHKKHRHQVSIDGKHYRILCGKCFPKNK